jgi:hypothetical protein
MRSMRTMRTIWRTGALAAAALLLAACPADDGERRADGDVALDGAAGTAEPAEPAPQPRQDPPDLRLEVDVEARQLRVYRNDEQVATHPVAVGRPEWPTRTGEWTINQVVWNPRWIPPEEEWAEEEEEKDPGDPENPLGRAQLVYDAPRSIHGTNEPGSLGQAASHGSIRVSNEVAIELARMVMEAGGAGRDEEFYRRVRENRSERVDVGIPNPVPIRVR